MTTYQDKNLKEELKIYKQILEGYRLALKNSIDIPNFIDELSYEFAYNNLPLGEDENDEKKIEEYREKILDSLNDLLIKYSSIFPFKNTLEKYITNKQQYYPTEYLNRLEELTSALGICNVILDKDFHKNLDKATKQIEHGASLNEIIVPKIPSIFDKVELNILAVYYRYTSHLIEDAISASLSQLRLLPFTLRTAIELAVNGFFYEHLLHPSYEKTIPPISWRKQDSVPTFIKRVKYKAKECNLDTRTILLQAAKYRIRTPNFYDIVYWLDRWKVFTPIPDPNKFFKKRYSNLSETIHGYLNPLVINLVTSTLPEYSIQELTYIIDSILLGSLNTIRNLRFNKILLLRDHKFWKELEEHAQKAELKLTVYRLQHLFI